MDEEEPIQNGEDGDPVYDLSDQDLFDFGEWRHEKKVKNAGDTNSKIREALKILGGRNSS